MTHRELWFWLLSLKTHGPVSISRLLSRYGDPEGIWAARGELPLTPKQKNELEESRKRPEQYQQGYQQMITQGIRMITVEDSDYPRRLRPLAGAPYGIFCRGLLPEESAPAVAIIGARACTPHGMSIAEKIAGDLTSHGVSIISGMAAGIDGSSHWGALNAGGYTCAVLGCGVDVCYPSSHRRLYRSLTEKGGILSEFPPGTPPLSPHFPQRNRIISGLSDLVLVVEAREKSGSLITVDHALEQGREVMMVPGRPDDPLSVGCNLRIGEGAAIYIGTQSILSLLSLPDVTGPEAEEFPGCTLTQEEQTILSFLGPEPKHLEQLTAESGMTPGELLFTLLNLEVRGCIRQVMPGQYQTIPRGGRANPSPTRGSS